MVQALVCSQDWLRTKGALGVDMEENMRELKELEKGYFIIVYLFHFLFYLHFHF